MKKLILSSLLISFLSFQISAQSTDSTKLELGIQVSEFPSYLRSAISSSLYFFGGDESRSLKVGAGIDVRYRLSSKLKLRVILGYGIENYSAKDTSGSLNAQGYGSVSSMNYELNHNMFQSSFGLVYEHYFGKFGIVAGPEISYYQSLKLKINQKNEYKYFDSRNTQTEITLVESKIPSQHHFGAGFFLALNFKISQKLLLSGELRQLYLYSVLKGKAPYKYTETTFKNANPPEVFTYEKSRDVNTSSAAFQVAMPSISLRYCW